MDVWVRCFHFSFFNVSFHVSVCVFFTNNSTRSQCLTAVSCMSCSRGVCHSLRHDQLAVHSQKKNENKEKKLKNKTKQNKTKKLHFFWREIDHTERINDFFSQRKFRNCRCVATRRTTGALRSSSSSSSSSSSFQY